MARSLAAGDYRLVAAVESASAPDRYYRVLADRQNGELSCDCPRWIFKRRRQERGCKHTTALTRVAAGRPAGRPLAEASTAAHEASLLTAARAQWRGLDGRWSLEERGLTVGRDQSRLVTLRLETATGLQGQGHVVFAQRHRLDTARLIPGVAGWAGYGVAAQVARAAGYEMAGSPPEHYQMPRRGRRSDVALRDILRVGDQVDLGDGLTPAERAERTLQLFLGDHYRRLQAEGYLDVSSRLHAARQRVYRLRRDPRRQRVKRVRLFERGVYVNDLCIVPAAHVPEADHLLTLFLQLVSDEASVLAVVQRYNIFPPFSDSGGRDDAAPIWQPRPAA